MASGAVPTWRYLFNDVGDLIAVRDPRGCGQNFYYDHAGRLIAEDYVECGEVMEHGDLPAFPLPVSAIAEGEIGTGAPQYVDARYYFDEDPEFIPGFFPSPRLVGRASGSVDRTQASAVAYDARGQAETSIRIMAVLPEARTLHATITDLSDDGVDTVPTPVYAFDYGTAYFTSTKYDYMGRPVEMMYPDSLDGTSVSNVLVRGRLSYNRLGLPTATHVDVFYGSTAGMPAYSTPIVRDITYDENRLPTRLDYGDSMVTHDLHTEMYYDNRLRPVQSVTARDLPMGATALNAVTTVHDFHYVWDAVSNLTEVRDEREVDEWPAGYRPWRQTIEHDALYRVNEIDINYRDDSDDFTPLQDDVATDWRTQQVNPNDDSSSHGEQDPMRRRPAGMVSPNASTRVRNLVYDYDWLANMTDWTDDKGVFYERSAGLLTSGNDAPDFDGWAPTDRPSALYLSTNIGDAGGVPDAMADRGGYVWLDYGQSGNVMGMTVHGQCHDVDASHVCEDVDPESTSAADRKVAFEAGCLCAQEQHYRYDWDELNRLAEARRYDRTGGTGAWTLAVQQRYQYDAGNVRMIKQTIDHSGSPFAAVTLTPYPGNFERRGLELNTLSETYDSSPTLGSESQYNVGGARLVWRTDDTVTGDLTRQQRLTLPLSDLLQSTAAVVDLQSGDLIEHTTFYPNGARETHLATDEVSLQLEPNGFTGKEADEEVGLVYFGERYLIPRLGRWASVDPLSVHAMGGGEVMNGYHYVAGNVLQARDPIGLQGGSSLFVGDMNAVPTPATETASVETSVPNVALTIQTNMVLDRPGARTGVSRNSYVGVTVSLMGVSDQSTRFIQFIRTTSYREATDRVGGRTGPLQTPAVQRQRTNIGDEILHNGQGQWMVDSTSRNGRYDGVVSRGDTQYTMWDAPGTGTSRSTGGAVVPSDILSTLLTEPVRIIETVQEVETYAFVNGEVVACATWEVRTTYRLVGGRNVRPENANVQITQEHTLVGVQSASSLPDDRQAQLNAYTANPRSQFRVNDSTPSGGNSGSGGQAAPSTSSGGSSP